MIVFKTKPVEVRAFRYTGDYLSVCAFLLEIKIDLRSIEWMFGGLLKIQTLASGVLVEQGDWLVSGANGELSCYDPDDFFDTYEEVVPLKAYDANLVKRLST